jgi:arylsulfatase A-like enzyme
MIVTATLVEVSLLAWLGGSAVAMGWRSVVAVTLLKLCLWSNLAWGCWIAGRALLGPLCQWTKWFQRAMAGLLLAVLAGATATYVASWCLFSMTHRFANIETLEFMLHNDDGWLAHYLWLVEWRSVAMVGATVIATVVAGAWGMRVSVREAGTPVTRQRRLGKAVARGLVWLALPVGVVFAYKSVLGQQSMTQRGIWKDAFLQRTDPCVTFVLSLAQAATIESIPRALDVEELHRLSSSATVLESRGGGRQPSIVILAIESLRHDVVGQSHQGREIMPNLNTLARNGIQFTRAYSQSTHSDYADPCILSSLYPLRTRSHHYYQPNDPWPKCMIYDLLQPQGYASAVISAQNEHWGGMAHFLRSPQLDYFYDAEVSDHAVAVDMRDVGMASEVKSGALRHGRLLDEHVTDVALDWIRAQVVKEKPFVLGMNFQSSHFPYDLPNDLERAFQPCEMNFPASFAAFAPRHTPVVRNAYFNSLRECDRQLGRIVDALRSLGRLEDTILVVLGENGEAFHENNSVCHAGNPTEPTIRVACVVHAPGRHAPAQIDYPMELIDVVPTVLGLFGCPAHPNFQGLDVLSADRPPLEQRWLFFHTNNPLSRADAALLAGRWKLMRDLKTSQESLFDIESDPGEQRNLIGVAEFQTLAQRLRENLGGWRSRQLAYYHYPDYYLRYYPPKQPRCPAIAASDAPSGP